MRAYRHLDTITALFVAVLLISNVASTKIVDFGIFSFDGGTLLFPLAYIFGDILTEVYGYARSRRVIWLGFAGSALMAATLALVNYLPAAKDWPYQEAFQTILGQTVRIVIASLAAYFAGEFANSYILAKLKIATKGKYLWMRTIGSTLIGEGLDTIIFCLIAFYGAFDNQLLLVIIASNYVFKVGVEILFTPLTYGIVGFLKRAEKEDFYDKKTNFNPFKIEV